MQSNKIGLLIGISSVTAISIGLCVGVYTATRMLLGGMINDTFIWTIAGLITLGAVVFFMSLIRNVWFDNEV